MVVVGTDTVTAKKSVPGVHVGRNVGKVVIPRECNDLV
jgi:hypothetical protein